MIEVLECYRKLYPESWYYQELPCLYYLAGEYELCAQLIGEMRELFPDNSSVSANYKDEKREEFRDEFGRVISSTNYYDGDGNGGKHVEECEYEYGQNGKLIRMARTSDTGNRIVTNTIEYEYDSEGRLSKTINSQEDNPGGSSIIVSVWEYSGGGYTVYENVEGYQGTYKITSKYAVDEYGEAKMVGEADYQEVQ